MPLSVNAHEWKNCVLGLTVRSNGLRALDQALENYDNGGGTVAQLRAVYQAFQQWKTNHPGEVGLLKGTNEFKELEQDFVRLQATIAGSAKPAAFIAGLWTASSAETWPLSIATRISQLDSCLARLSRQISISSAGHSFNGPIQGVFLAPEYFFSAQGNKRAPLEELHYYQVERELYGLSKKYPEILIVPGTIFYKKNSLRPQHPVAAFKVNEKTGKRDLKKTSDPDRRVRLGFELLEAAKNTQKVLGKSAVMQGDIRTATNHIVPSHLELADTLLDKSKLPGVARNAAYLFLNGRRYAKYDKQTDFKEALSNSPDNLMFIPGTKDQCPEVLGYRCGMEICYDHANGVLSKRAPANLHFHFVVSDWADTTLANMAMANGGYFFHASTNYQQASVFWRSAAGILFNLTEAVSVHVYSEPVGSSSHLDLYCLPVPPANNVVAPPPVPLRPVMTLPPPPPPLSPGVVNLPPPPNLSGYDPRLPPPPVLGPKPPNVKLPPPPPPKF